MTLPVDQKFAQLLQKAKALTAAQRKLNDTEAARAQRALEAANRAAARFEWRPVRAVAIIEDQTCMCCGSVNQLFRGFGVLMRRQADDVTRIVEAHGLDEGFPRGRYFIQTKSEACMECLPEKGI